MALLDRLGLTAPIIQAPMGGFTSPELVAAVSEAGGLGSLGTPYMQPDAVAEQASAVRRLTARPFAMNLFIFDSRPVEPDAVARASARLAPYCAELGIDPPVLTGAPHPDIDAQIEAVLEARPAVFSFTFGIPSPDVLDRCRRSDILTLGTATTLSEGLALQAAGVDAVCAQGSEAGGHRGNFLAPWQDSMVGVLPLVNMLARNLDVPVVAAGGIMTGEAVCAVLHAGAEAAQLGTAFLACPEATTPEPHKALLTTPAAARTGVTTAFSGRAARGIVNRYMEEMEGAELAPFPVLNSLTRGMRAAAAKAGRTEFMSLWTGQGAPLTRPLPASELMARLKAELAAA